MHTEPISDKSEQAAEPVAAAYSDDRLRDIWKLKGGSFHGPNIETGTMPEVLLLEYLRSLYTQEPIGVFGGQRLTPFGTKEFWGVLADHIQNIEVGAALYTQPRAAVPARWQPIETAPKDGTEVLLKVKRRAGIPGKCLVGHYMPGGYCIEDHPPIDAGWYFWNGRIFDKAAEPVGWMALPSSDDAEN